MEEDEPMMVEGEETYEDFTEEIPEGEEGWDEPME